MSIFNGIFDSDLISVISLDKFLLVVGVALLIGIFLAGCYKYRTKHSNGFLATLALLPAVVAVVIMMVNGNVGTGVAVAGAFSLVRFRSAPGSATEIVAIFLAMTTGLMAGMGYLAYAALTAIVLGMISVVFKSLDISLGQKNTYKTLSITIPEDLDYTNVFADIFEKYTNSATLNIVKTTNMGSLFRLTYDVTLKSTEDEKKFIDALRVRNGNLEIAISNQPTVSGTL